MISVNRPIRREYHETVWRVGLVDDHPLLRRGLQNLLETQPQLAVCGEAGDATGALRLAESEHPDLMIVDLALREGHGIDLICRLRSHFPDMKILVLSMHDETLYAPRALQAGAHGYVAKHQPPEELLAAVHAVLRGEMAVSPRLGAQLVRDLVEGRRASSDPLQDLSNRELEVFEMIGQGLATKQIAGRLHLSPKTIETHREKIKSKLRLSNSLQLNRRAVQWVLETH